MIQPFVCKSDQGVDYTNILLLEALTSADPKRAK